MKVNTIHSVSRVVLCGEQSSTGWCLQILQFPINFNITLCSQSCTYHHHYIV